MNSQRDVPIRDHSHPGLRQDSHGNSGDNVGLEDRLCPGCKKSAVSEHGGLVVAFGQSFFHVDCFKCAKCGDQVTADTNLLLLSDGSPICANCSYSCNVCHLPILDEAIMTGDDSYHAHCFKCKVCKSRIDELVFAKTTKGIYCMNCHNERMINLRKHTQRKAERERAAGGSNSTKSREREARSFHRDNEVSSPLMDGRSQSHGLQSSNSSRPSSSRGADVSASVRSPAKPHSGSYVSDAFGSNPPTPALNITSQPSNGKPLPSLSSISSSQSISATVAPPSSGEYSQKPKPLPPKYDVSVEQDRPDPVKQNTLPIPHGSVVSDPDGRRRSYDDGVRPLNVLFGRNGDSARQEEFSSTAITSPEGLTVSTSRRDKRRSINPALSLSDFSLLGASPASPISPRSTSFQHQLDHRIPTPPTPGGRESPQALSPLPDHFLGHSPPSRPTSHNSTFPSRSSVHSQRVSASLSDSQTLDISRTSSPSGYTEEQSQDQTIVVNRSPLSTVTLESVPPAKQRGKNGHDVQTLPTNDAPRNSDQSYASLSSKDVDILRSTRSFDDRRPKSRPGSDNPAQYPLSRSRSISPAYRVDVPQNIESETDTEAEGDNSQRAQARESLPPAPPPKEEKDILVGLKESALVIGEVVTDVSIMLSPDSGSDDMSESSPVERMQRSTFIAPALPPIRFSMPADFSGLFNVESVSSFKPLDQLAKISEDRPQTSPTQLPIAALEHNLTPTRTTIIVSTESPHDERSKTYDFSINDDDQSASGSPSESFYQESSSKSSNSNPDLDNQTVLQVNGPVGTLQGTMNPTSITLTEPGATSTVTLRHDTDIVSLRLHEVITDARERGAQQVKLDMDFIEAILATLETRKVENQRLKNKFDGIKRASKQYIDGLTVAQTEYDRELKARRDAEAEVTRLRVLLSGQVARLTALSGDSRREELRQQLSRELHDNLSGLEHDLSKLIVERDMTLAEVEELSATRTTPDLPSANLGRSLTKRLETIKTQYKRDLVPLTQERETLTREVAELKAVRDVFLEETTVLNTRNEELAQLSAVYFRRMEGHPGNSNTMDTLRGSLDKPRSQPLQAQQSMPFPPSLSASTSGSSTAHEDNIEPGRMGVPKTNLEQHTPSKGGGFRKWGSKAKGVLSPPAASDRKAHQEHNFQQLSVLRFTRCDHCGDKMWGSQLRCTVCNTSIHVRCASHVQIQCAQQIQGLARPESPPMPLPPSMFGRDLVEQVHADSKDEERHIPVIVEKCIDAVETLALDYEGIYRKTGGSGQSKAITQLFERGDYASFDLRDDDRFNDICSVTSVLKNYFRSLPVPLLTYDLHDQFMSAVHIRDPAIRHSSLLDLVNKLPSEHYHTLRVLMLHLHRVRERSERNLMNARNLGVVFGPTLMRSQDPSAEFSDMAGKALSIEWLVDNAPFIFNEDNPN
ncbi:hypothetical protein BDZ94DRAFT_1264138 [Collybia nuda]|uniref:RhoGAP-domain-containing protein n=1 Tax=Collybia nuda TaxID=64659 RepID=A0A9P5Y2W1_9AGAR|nr:hypothetical protein BDZ94DRAFT_1264138 [Collybia nuda]